MLSSFASIGLVVGLFILGLVSKRLVWIMRKEFLLVGFGLATWLLPFLFSFLFFDMNTQKLTIDETFFKSIMIVFSGIVGVALLVQYFKSVKKDFVNEGVRVGSVWALMNWLLDFVILLPMSKMDVATYFMQIGFRYLIVPTISIGMGYALEHVEKTRKLVTQDS